MDGNKKERRVIVGGFNVALFIQEGDIKSSHFGKMETISSLNCHIEMTSKMKMQIS